MHVAHTLVSGADYQALYTHSVFQRVFVGGTFDFFDVMCKHLLWILLTQRAKKRYV